MSEEILKALMHLFAIIIKLEAGEAEKELKYVQTFLTSQLSEVQVTEYYQLFLKKLAEEEKKRLRAEAKAKKKAEKEGRDISNEPSQVASALSVRIMGICRKINKTLTHAQKIVVLARLFELLSADQKFTKIRVIIIGVIADTFNITKGDFNEIESYTINQNYKDFNSESILLINDKEDIGENCKSIRTESLHGSVIILQVKSAELYFLKYTGKQDVYLNGMPVYNNRLYLFAPGSTVKLPKGKPAYYSDVVAHFLADLEFTKLSFVVDKVQYRFKTGDIGIRDISFSVEHGRLVGIMGASGSGKTTLVNSLSGITTPSEGQVLINGYDLHHEKGKLEGVIGYIPQDDLLIEELTVFQNLYYNAKLCFKDLGEEEITNLVHKVLKDLGLFDKKDLKVGNPMNKTISGGQRKRLNIALELIREPSILFVDEPTSGLSSRDSENVMELLSELTQKGKLIFVVIHQPSSDIYKMFDKMIILDTGGYMIYSGNPVEAVVYFKTIDNQINSGMGECPVCGNITPEVIFDIIESEVVDEFGQYTELRKVTPTQWKKHYDEKCKIDEVEEVTDDPPSTLQIPSWFKQLKIFTIRDILSKVSNMQYIVLNLLEAPLLGFILSFLIRYIADPESSEYILYKNENIPPYIFMSIVVALFLGLTVSAEEIFRDRKILKREKFLNLSRSSYLVSKVIILTIISAIQSFLFVIIGNTILGIEAGMYFPYWLSLFSIFVFANMMGLNISATFNSAVTIYILIPLLMIPQMSLGGAMFSFNKLNRILGSVDKVPLVAEFMASRWIYEALMVHQFKENSFKKVYFDVEQRKANAVFKKSKYKDAIVESLDLLELTADEIEDGELNTDSLNNIRNKEFAFLKYELANENKEIDELLIKLKKALKPSKYNEIVTDTAQIHIPITLINKLNINDYTVEDVGYVLSEFVENRALFYEAVSQQADRRIEFMKQFQNKKSKGYYNRMRNTYHNEHLDDIVRGYFERTKVFRYKNRLVRQEELIYKDAENDNFIGIRSHFYAPKKYFMGRYYDTFYFNLIIVWLMSILLYPPLYYEHLKRIMNFAEKRNKYKKKTKKIEKDEDKKEDTETKKS